MTVEFTAEMVWQPGTLKLLRAYSERAVAAEEVLKHSHLNCWKGDCRACHYFTEYGRLVESEFEGLFKTEER